MMPRICDLHRAFTKKIERGLFDGVRKGINHLYDPDNQFQEGLASVWRSYHKTAQRGKILSDNMLLWLLHRRVRNLERGRAFTGGQGQRRDAMGMPAILLDGIEVKLFFEDFVPTVSSEDAVIAMIDFLRDLERFDPVDRAILLAIYKGRPTKEIAQELGLTTREVCDRAKELGKMLQTSERKDTHVF